MQIIWNGHSCFTVRSADGTIILDPYEDRYVPGYPPLRLEADQVLCSHEHSDHNARRCVRLSGKPCGFQVERIASWHDDVRGAKRGGNTIHLLTLEGMRLAHLGDLGCELNETQLRQLENLDVLLVPVGGHYTIDAAQAAEIVRQLRPRVVIPMHYRGKGFGYDVLSTVDEFRALTEHPVDYPGNTLEVDLTTEAQTAFLKP